MPNRMFSTVKLAMIASIATMTLLASATSQERVTIKGTGPAHAKAGSKFMASLTFTVPAGFHIYSPSFKPHGDVVGTPTAITLIESPKGYKTLSPISPAGEQLSGSVTFKVPVIVPKTAKGRAPLSFSVVYQQCNDRICLPPTKLVVLVTTTVS